MIYAAGGLLVGAVVGLLVGYGLGTDAGRRDRVKPRREDRNGLVADFDWMEREAETLNHGIHTRWEKA